MIYICQKYKKYLMNKMYCLFFFLFPLNFYSQEKYDYYGAIKLNGNDKTVITYRLVFSENNGIINGFAVTDIGGAYETKNTITGTYNKKSKELNFKEIDVLYTKSKLNENTFCFVNFSGKVKLASESSKLEGDFKGFYENNKPCINGTMTLIGSNKLYKLFDKINNKIQSSKRVDAATKQKINPLKILDSLKVNNIVKDQNLNVFFKSENIEIFIWDNQVEDGDRVNIFQNNVLILKDFEIMNKKKKINVALTQEINTFRIEAINEGDKSPNTASIQLVDKERVFDLVSVLKKGEKTSITIIKK
jgi:hypothetical protein